MRVVFVGLLALHCAAILMGCGDDEHAAALAGVDGSTDAHDEGDASPHVDFDAGIVDASPPTDASVPEATSPHADADADAAASETCAEGTWDDDQAPATPCVMWSTCAEGTYVSQLPTASSDRACTACPAGTYASATNQTACVAWSTCAPGMYVLQSGTASSDRTCAGCPADHYSTVENAPACIDGRCSRGTVQTAPATTTAPATCAACAPGTWDDDANPLSACVAWRDCGVGEFTYAPGSATRDRGCTTCPLKTYNASTVNAAACSPWSECPAGTYVSSEGTRLTDRICTACAAGYSSGGKSIPFCHAPVVGLTAGAGHTCAVLADGKVACWGYNFRGALGDGTTATSTVPRLVPGLDGIAQISAGQGHTCALSNDGTVRCWGWNQNGQLGDGTTADRYSPTLVTGLTGVVEIATQGWSTCARLVDGSVRCWGYNAYGELGDGTLVDRTSPVPVLNVANATSLAVGLAHGCASFADGTAKCWGFNLSGTMGDGTSGEDRTTPSTPVSTSGVAQLALGANTSCARRVDGTVACWGEGGGGQLGNGTGNGNSISLVPTEVLGISTATGLVGYQSLFCAVLNDGTARYWGNDSAALLAPPQLAPATLPFDGITGAAAGQSHMCVVSHGNVMCWGANNIGQLGDGTTASGATWRAVAW